MKGNIRARKFYEKNGFQISGKEREIEIAECRWKKYEKVTEQMVLHNQEKNIEELLYSYVAAFLL